MFGMTRKRLTGISSALTMALVLVLMLTSMASSAGPVEHRVSVGGPDGVIFYCQGPQGLHPGCDGNFSLVAIQYADDSVSGQYTDQFAQRDGGFHAVVNCVYVDGNDAWVSGFVTRGQFTDPDTGEVLLDLTGLPIATRVRDNGTSAHDPDDQISYSWYGEGFAFPCTDHVDYELFDMPNGQVNVR